MDPMLAGVRIDPAYPSNPPSAPSTPQSQALLGAGTEDFVHSLESLTGAAGGSRGRDRAGAGGAPSVTAGSLQESLQTTIQPMQPLQPWESAAMDSLDEEGEEEGEEGEEVGNNGGVEGVSSQSGIQPMQPMHSQPGVLRPGIVHRLDLGTSGLVVVAKREVAQRALAAQFKARTVGGWVGHMEGPVQVGATVRLHPGLALLCTIFYFVTGFSEECRP